MARSRACGSGGCSAGGTRLPARLGGTEGWRLRECEEFGRRGPSAPWHGGRRRRRKRSCSPQTAPKWELAVGLAGGFREVLSPTPAPDPCGWCLSPRALAAAVGWVWGAPNSKRRKKPTQIKHIHSSPVLCWGLVSERRPASLQGQLHPREAWLMLSSSRLLPRAASPSFLCVAQIKGATELTAVVSC